MFAGVVSVSRLKVIDPGRLLEVTLPPEALFLDGTATLRPGREEMVGRLAKLAESGSGAALELEFLAAAGPLAAARATALARALDGAGAPAGSVTAGIEAGPPDRARLLFHLVPAGG